MFFCKTPMFLFAFHNETLTKKQCYWKLRLRRLVKANTLNRNVSLFGSCQQSTHHFATMFAAFLNFLTKEQNLHEALLSILLFVHSKSIYSIIQVYPSSWLNSLFKKNALKSNYFFKETSSKKKPWSTASI